MVRQGCSLISEQYVLWTSLTKEHAFEKYGLKYELIDLLLTGARFSRVQFLTVQQTFD